MRPDKDSYYLKIAEVVATRSTCLHRQYGAVIVKDDKIVSTGYNGSPRGEVNCCDTFCYRDRFTVPIDSDAQEHGSKYGTCVAVHAEQNAIIAASFHDLKDSTLYLASTDSSCIPVPCNMCNRIIKNAGIKYLITRSGRKEL